LPHLTVGSREPAPKLSLHALFNHVLNHFTSVANGRNCPSKGARPGARRSATLVSGGLFAAGWRMAVSMRSSRRRC
jgi:hypothetical protein